MSKTKKIAILAIIAMVLTLMPTALFAATADSTRLEGAGRVETALDIASAGWTTAGTVVLAPADQANLVDALAAAPLAGQENAPILLTFKGSLDAAVKAKIAALGATKVYVVGAVSDAVAAEVDAIANVTVEKLAGADRWATADAVNAKLTNPAGTFVVGYDAIADALSASSYAAKNKFAIVLAKADGTVDSAKLVGATKYIVGGTAKVAEISGVTRLSGADRYATNSAVASKLSYSYDRIYVANGVSLVDALAVAPLAAKYNAFVALASNSDVAAASVVNAKLNSSSKIIAVGGVNAVSEAVKGKVNTTNASVAITSVTAPDLGQIKVVYNKALSKTSSVDPLNYTLVAKNGGVANLTAATFTLSDDQMYVTIDLATLLTNQKDYTLTVKDVYDAAGNKLAETSKDFAISDLTLPEVSKVEITGTKTIKVTMSENVAASGGPQDRVSFKLDNGALSAPSFAVGTGTAREFITLTLAAELSEGSHTLTIEAVKDLAGLYSVKAEYPLNYAKDKSAPTVSIKEIKADAKTVVLKFNKDIDPANLVGSTNINFSHTYKGSNQVNGTVVTQKTPSEYELVFANPIPPGTTSIFIDYASGITDAQKVKDLFGNVFAAPVTLTTTISADFTAPTVTSVSQKDADEIYVNFSEDVNAADAQIVGNYRLVNSKNETINLTSATYVAADKRTTLKATANLEAGAYTLEVKNVNDKAVVPNKMTTATFNIDLLDKVAPVVDAAAWTAASKKLTVKFSKDMVGSELTVLSNYALMVDGASKDWPSGTAIALKDSKTVEITLGSSVTGLDAAGGDAVQLSGAFKSASGVAIGGISVSKTIVVDTTIVPAYVADSAKVTKKDEVTFELNAELQAINFAKITFNGAPIADASYVNNGSKSVVTLKLAAPLANTAIGGWAGAGIQTTAAGGAYTAKFGGAEAGSVTLVAGANIKDKCAPYLPTGGVVTSDADKDGQIDTLTLTLSEPVIGSTVAVADFSVSDSYSINSVTSVAGAVVTLKLNESGLSDTAVKPSVAINGAMEDLANNGTSAGDAVVATDGAAPVVVAVKISTPGATAGFGNDLADAITLTFSEPVNTNFTAAAAPTIAELDAIFDSSDAATPFASGGAATFAATDLSVTASNTMVITLGGVVLTNVLVVGDTFYTDAAPTANDIEDVANRTIAGSQPAIAATN